MRLLATLSLVSALCLVGACGNDGSDGQTGKLSAADAVQKTCEEVRAGIDEFNQKDYRGTVKHFQKAVSPAKIYAKAQPEPETRALLDAVNYYAALPPASYPEAARDSADFARHKAVTLNQCASGEPIDSTPGLAT